MTWIDRSGSTAATIAQLSRSLNVDPEDRLEAIDRSIVDGPQLPGSQWAAAAATFETGTANDRKQGGRLREAIAASGTSQRQKYLSLFLTAEGERRKTLVTDRLAKSQRDFADRLDREADRLMALLDRRRAVAMRDRTAALITIASAVATSYRREKNERGLLDYDDLIDRSLGMLEDKAGRLGPLQARSRHRPCADRRSAGYQSEAMADRYPPDRGFYHRQGRTRRDGTYNLCCRRREAVDLFVSGCGSARIRRARGGTSNVNTTQPNFPFIPSLSTILFDRVSACCGRCRALSRRKRSITASRPTAMACRRTCHSTMPHQVWSTCGSYRSPTIARTSRAGARRSMRFPRPVRKQDLPNGWPARSDR